MAISMRSNTRRLRRCYDDEIATSFDELRMSGRSSQWRLAGIFTLSPTLSRRGRGDYRCHCEERRRRGNLVAVEHTSANRGCYDDEIATSFDELRMSGRSSQWRLAGIFTLSPTLSRRGRGDYRCHCEERRRRGNLVAVEHTSANRGCYDDEIATSFDELRMSGRSSQ